jgi:hypothetical protein
MPATVIGSNLRSELSATDSALENIETTLCNYIVGDEPEATNETIAALMGSVEFHLRRLMFEIRSAGTVGTLSANDIPRFIDSTEDDDDSLSGAIGRVLDTMQPLLRRIGEVVESMPLGDAILNAKLLVIDHLAALTLQRAEQCREIAAA